jgi:F-box protein 9
MSGSATPPESAEADITLEGLSLDEFTIAIDQKRSRTEQAIIEGGDQDELERFRQEWRAEVKGRQGMDVGPPKRRAEAKDSEDSDTQQRVTLGASPVLEFRPATSPKARMTSPIASTAGLPDSQQDLSPVKAARSPEAGPSRVKARSKQTAVELYAEAVEHEQAGQLNDALMLYRRAFKIDGKWSSMFGVTG